MGSKGKRKPKTVRKWMTEFNSRGGEGLTVS